MQSALSASGPYLASSKIEPRLRALAELRVSQINGCAYCVDLHCSRPEGGTSAAASLRLFAGGGRETPFFDDRERRAWAESVTLVSETGVPDAVFDEARKHSNATS